MHRVLGLAGVLIVWEVAARGLGSPMLPPFSAAGMALWSMLASGAALPHIAESLTNVLLGFCVAVALGIIIGTAVVQSSMLDQIVGPVVDSMRPIAALTLFPLLILLMGIGRSAKVFIIFWTAWPAVLLNTAQGLRKIDASIREAAQTEGAGRWPLLRYISFPLAMPSIMTGLRIGLSGGWISLVASEMLGSQRGLGYSILAYSQTFRFPEMYATIILIGLIGLGMNLILAAIQRRLDWEEHHEASPFYRFGDRAIGFGLDSLFNRSGS